MEEVDTETQLGITSAVFVIQFSNICASLFFFFLVFKQYWKIPDKCSHPPDEDLNGSEIYVGKCLWMYVYVSICVLELTVSSGCSLSTQAASVWSLTRQSSNADLTHWVEFILSLNSTFVVQLFKQNTQQKKHELAIKKDGRR